MTGPAADPARETSLDREFMPLERRLLERAAGGQRGFLLLRLVLAAVLLLQALTLPDGGIGWRWLALLPLAYAAAAVGFYLGAPALLDRLGAATFLPDVGVALALLRASEGRGAHVYLALMLLILGACFLKKPIWVFTVSMAVCLSYAVLAFPASEDISRVFPLHLSLLILIALFGIHIAEYASAVERETARRYEERLAWMQRLSMVGKAMAAVLHEAKTPLGTIVLSAEAAGEKLRKGKKAGDELGVIAAEAEHASAILQNFLDFVKPTQLDRKPLRAHEPLLQALGMAKVRLDERGVAVSTRTLDDCEVLGSARHLVQAFSNIVNNAVEAMPKGGSLDVSMERARGRVLFVFRDDGVGMTREALDGLFEPFSTSKASEEGHGLGLSIVRWIVQEHDGEITVESEGAGRGARVALELPLAAKS